MLLKEAETLSQEPSKDQFLKSPMTQMHHMLMVTLQELLQHALCANQLVNQDQSIHNHLNSQQIFNDSI